MVLYTLKYKYFAKCHNCVVIVYFVLDGVRLIRYDLELIFAIEYNVSMIVKTTTTVVKKPENFDNIDVVSDWFCGTSTV